MKNLIFFFFLCGPVCATVFLVSGEEANTGKKLDAEALALPILLVPTAGVERNPAGFPVASADVDPVVFDDEFGGNMDYSPFEYSYYDALTTESSGGYDNSPTLKVTVPPGAWAGGSFWTHIPRDLSSFNALTMWARGSGTFHLSECGIGIPIVAPALYQVGISNVSLTEAWTQVIIPLPNPNRLTAEQGMFWYAQGIGVVEIWLDEIIFGSVAGITNPRPSMVSDAIEVFLDEEVTISDTKTTFSVNGVDVEVVHSPAYFDYFSSDEAVLSTENGIITAVGYGTATITAMLNGTSVDGEVTVTVIGPPTEPAPTPTPDQASVISIFSDAYTNNITVDSWRTDWSSASVAVYDQQIQGDNVKVYTGLNNNAFVGIGFSSDQIDAVTPGMTHFTMDVFAHVGSMLAVKLVDFGPNGVYDGAYGDDTERELIFHADTTPAFLTGDWVSLDISLTQFTGMNFGNVAQMILRSTDIGNLWVDNIYFYNSQTSAVVDNGRVTVARSVLEPNVPNPFNPATKISYSIPGNEFVSLVIYSLDGRVVKTLVSEPQSMGRYEVIWNGVDNNGRRVASGTYLYGLKAGGFTELKKMTLVK